MLILKRTPRNADRLEAEMLIRMFGFFWSIKNEFSKPSGRLKHADMLILKRTPRNADRLEAEMLIRMFGFFWSIKMSSPSR